MTQPTPPPPPPPETDYLAYGLIGLLVGGAVVVMILVLGGGDDPGDAAPTSTTQAPATTPAPATTQAETTTAPESTSTTTTAASTTSAAQSFPGDTEPKTADGPAFSPFAFLADVRFAQREGFTRVVFDFEGTEVPWWSVGYTTGPFTNIGDEPIPVDGAAFIGVNLASTSFDLSGTEVRITYEGPDRIEVDSVSVTEVVVLEDFEGVSTWVIGVTAEKPFLVGTLTDPPRVYIDIQD